MDPDGRTDGMDGRTDAAKTISLRLRRGIKMCLCDNLFLAIWLSAQADNLVMYFDRREVIMPASVIRR